MGRVRHYVNIVEHGDDTIEYRVGIMTVQLGTGATVVHTNNTGRYLKDKRGCCHSTTQH